MFAIHLWQKKDAAVERAGSCLISDHYAASAAITFVAAFFGAGKVAFCAQPVE
jgi:hypothetical protein